MKWILIIIMMVTMVGCASLEMVKTTVTTPKGDVYTVNSKRNAVVSLKEGESEITVDNRGRTGVLENMMGMMLMKTDIKVSNKEGN